MTKDASITVRIPSDLKERLTTAAAAEDRTLSKLVERILRDWETTKPKRSR
jgi:predicted transcriptional regulator